MSASKAKQECRPSRCATPAKTEYSCTRGPFCAVCTIWGGSFSARMRYKIEDVVPLEGCALLVFFRDGAVKRCPLQNCFTQDRTFAPLLSSQEQFDRVEIQAGGYGVCWGESLEIADEALYRMGDEVPLGQEDFRMFVAQRVVNTAEAAQLLGCSKQNVDDLVRRGKLHPVKESAKSKLFLKSEIIQRSWL